VKILGIVFFLISTSVFSGKALDVDLSSDNTINIDAYDSNGETLFMYLPSGRGFGKEHVPTVQQLAFEGYDVWVVDLHSSYMIPKYRNSVDRFNIKDLVELVDFAKKRSFKKIFFLTSGRGAKLALNIAYQWQLKNPKSDLLGGHILHSPHLIDGRPELGENAKYIDISKYSNLPIYMLLSQFGTKYFRGEEIASELKKGGSSVFLHRLKGVRGGFYHRDVKDLTQVDIEMKGNLDSIYIRAINLMNSVKYNEVVKVSDTIKKTSKVTANEPELKPYKGKQNIPLKLSDYNGKTVDIKDYNNQVVLLNFWASWCKPCIKEMPSLVRLKNHFNHDDFKIVAINIGESKEQISEFIKKLKFDLPILFDNSGDAVKEWGVYAYPSNFVLDKNGVIRYTYRGALEWDSQSIINTIKTLL